MVEQQKENQIISLLKTLWGKISLSREELDRQSYDGLVNFYDSKYPVQPLYYAGSSVTIRGKVKVLSIQVCDYLHVTQSMRDWIKEHDLVFDKPVSKQNVWEHIWKVYSEFTKHTKYVTDINLYYINEQWVSNMQQMYIMEDYKFAGDCENFSLLCAGLIQASGVPRGLYRVTAGMTKLGGHASLTAYSPDSDDWVQLETTSKYPYIVGENDQIYISNVWFSFDSEYSFSNRKIKQVEVKKEAEQ